MTGVQTCALPISLFRDINPDPNEYDSHFNVDGRGIYGYHWWVNGIKADGERNLPDAPLGTFYRSGFNHNMIFVIPEWNMVIVRLGVDGSPVGRIGVWNTVLKKIGEGITDKKPQKEINIPPEITGELKKWHTVTISFTGPGAREDDTSPNPFLDYRLNVTFTAPGGREYIVPGFFDGNGRGNGIGNIWKVRFTPDEKGIWSYKASFRKGKEIAVDLFTKAGISAGYFDRAKDTFNIADRDLNASGFLKWGRLEYVNDYYLKFRDGTYWIKEIGRAHV